MLSPPASTGFDPVPEDSLPRRLVAIACLDVVGYSLLVAQDSAGTHRRWMTILQEIIRPVTHRHRGRVIKTTGDGMLGEFQSAFDAVEWARETQRLLREEAANHDGCTPPISVRIGVHLGDVLTTDGDIYGDGVNITVRLQEHAEPGGVVISGVVHNLVRGDLQLPARDLGMLQLKNIGEPIHAYAIADLHGEALAPSIARPVALPSIAVLPLRNLSGNPADDYFADGVVEDVVVSLANLRELHVTARASSLTVGRRESDPREIGRALGVRYVLTGTVRRSDELVRISLRLHDAESGASVWGGATETKPGDLFELQDRIVHRVVAGIAPHVRSAELQRALRKRPESFTAYDCTLRALDLIHSLQKPAFMHARDYLYEAMKHDPGFAMPVAWAARWHSLLIGQGWTCDREADARKAAELAAKAIELDRQNALALATYGHIRSFLLRDHDSGMVYFDRALEACPNSALAWTLSSATLSYIGRGDQAVRHAEHAIELSPFDQSLFQFYTFLLLAHYANGAYEQAVKWARMSLSENPLYSTTLRLLAASLAALGRLDEAEEAGRRLLVLEPDFTLGRHRRVHPFRDEELGRRFIEHLKKAGLPE